METAGDFANLLVAINVYSDHKIMIERIYTLFRQYVDIFKTIPKGAMECPNPGNMSFLASFLLTKRAVTCQESSPPWYSLAQR